MSTKHELTLKVLPRYLKASRKEKGKILDEYYANTDYNRKYVIWKLNTYQMEDKEGVEFLVTFYGFARPARFIPKSSELFSQ